MSNHPFVPLRHRAVRLLWSAAVISDIGTWVQLIVVGSLVASGTGSAVQTGLVALATFMPQGIASPLGGLLADRYDRRKVFASALLMQAFFTTALAVVLGAGVRTPLVLTALILMSSAAGATGAPSYAAMQPDLVPPDELMQMVSLGVYSWNSGRVVGPLLGSVMVLAVGPAWTIGFNAFSFVVMALAVTLVRRPFRPHGAAGTVRERLVGGMRAMRSTPGCWHALVMLALFNFSIVPFMGLIPIYVSAGYDGGTTLTGVVASAQGIGAIIGGILATMLAVRYGRSTLVGWVAIGIGIALAAYALAPNEAWLIAIAAVLGGGWSSMFIALSAVIQRDAPPASRGRVMSLMQATLGISYGSGLLFIGAIGDAVNMHVAFGVGATVGMVGFALLTLRARNWRAALDGTEREPQADLVTC
ncbi:MAG: MFS transporter [Ilumatobacteraceae bacterium]